MVRREESSAEICTLDADGTVLTRHFLRRDALNDMHSPSSIPQACCLYDDTIMLADDGGVIHWAELGESLIKPVRLMENANEPPQRILVYRGFMLVATSSFLRCFSLV